MKYLVKTPSGQVVGWSYDYSEAKAIKAKSLDYLIVILYC